MASSKIYSVTTEQAASVPCVYLPHPGLACGPGQLNKRKTGAGASGLTVWECEPALCVQRPMWTAGGQRGCVGT